MILLLVESPTKANTLKTFLGKNYQVIASMGHIRDLPKSELGVDIENNFQPKYIIPVKARKTISAIKKEVAKTEETILATDEDREGEAIAWHLAEVLKLKNPKRIVFHEITKKAIEEALENPRQIDMGLADSQQARRILDRIVGYQLSPFLWKKVARGLSAGRVQSVALRLVAEREEEIKNFKSEEYWSIIASFLKNNEFDALLIKKDDKPITKLEIKNKAETDKILNDLEKAEYIVKNIEKKETKKNPFPPFITSTLQQEAWKRFKLPAKSTMRIAQQLYEKGFISYHRTDSVNLSELALTSSKKFIEENYGKSYWPGYHRKFKTKNKAQEAHEAIRPTIIEKTPEIAKSDLDFRQYKIYELIWKRFIACQMTEAVFNSIVCDIKAKEYVFRANGQTLKYDGFLKVYPIKFEEKELPDLEKEEVLALVKIIPNQHFTQPPARYNEASLIKELEKNGIGRPSTYASILSTIQERNYIEKNEERRFRPTEIGTTVNGILTEHFPEVVDINFTAKMEEDLDKIADEKKDWTKVCEEFYIPFSSNLNKKYFEVSKKQFTEKPTGKTCPKCGSPLIERLGKFGRFYACSKFPECRYTESLEKNKLNLKCSKCKQGNIVEKRTKTRKIFYGCDRYPDCDFALWDKPTGEFCKECNSMMIQTRRKKIVCSNKDCKTNKKVG